MSDTDSDALNENVRRTKRKFVVKFQIEDESSDDSDVAGPSNRVCRNHKKKLTVNDSCDDSDFEGYPNQKNDTNHPIMKNENDNEQPSTLANTTDVSTIQSDNANSSDSDSSCDGTEKCPICLHSFRDQEVGAPNVCEHSFCAPCIEEWSNNVQTCPIDRKPFTIIRIRLRYTDEAFVREIMVNTKSIEPEPIAADFTNCEICGRNDHEESMLLCDGCDAGYHMECLDPPLIEIPEGSWYCDNCFDSDTSEDDVDITQLIAELDDLPVPATRLRVRREITPRITRTRQSERIRTTILSRRQGEHSDDTAVLDLSMPGSSRGRQTVTTTTTTTTISTRKTTTTTRKSRVVRGRVQKPRRRRKVKNRRRKTYVVEYDVDDCNHKFGIKTAKRVIKRRRKARKSHKKSCSRRRGGHNVPEAFESVSNASNKIREQYPKLHLFGNKNALEYFSDEDENDDGIDTLNNSFDTGDGLIVMARSQPSIGGRNLLRRKNIVVRAPAPSEPDLLSNIMDSMNRWHSISRPTTIDKIKINSDGSLEGKAHVETTLSSSNPNSDIQSAPMYPRNGAAGNGNRSFNNSNGFRGGNSNRNSGNFSNFSGGNRNSGQFAFQSFQRRGDDGHRSSFGENFAQHTNPFQRQRGSNRNRLPLTPDPNQNQPQRGLYDGEDVGPLQNEDPIQNENDVINDPEPPTKGVQQDVISNDDDNNSTSNQDSNEAHGDNAEVNDPNNESLPSISNTEGSNEPAAFGQSTKSNDDDYTDSDDADDQNFEYSEVSMQVAKDSKDSPEKNGSEDKPSEQQNSSFVDNDEDLVQLDDDENFANETADGISEEQINNEDKISDNESQEAVVAETNLDKSKNDDSAEEISASEEDQRSYTPLNDRVEWNDKEKKQNDQPSTSTEKNEPIKSGIEGMDTEMISEDENENILHDETTVKKNKVDKENNNRKSEADESFKKVSKSTKDRNYRDKKEKSDGKRRNRRSRSRSKSSSRSASRGRGHRNSRKDKTSRRKEVEKRRQEIQRYDVRTVIAERQPRTYKDKYGRDTSRPPRSISQSPRRDRKSFSRSPSPVYSPRRRSVSRRSPSRTRRRSPSIRRYRRSVSHRRRSPHRNFASSRSKSFSRDRFMNGGRSRSKSRSYTPKPTHRYHLHNSRSRSGSIDRRSKRKPIDKKVSKNRSKKKSDSRRVSPFRHSPNRSSRSRSWNDRGSWNRSLSDIPNEDIPSWTPPIAHAPENLTVILKNKDSKRKRDKKRKTEKRKTEIIQKMKEKRRRTDKQDLPAVPSKEVFASGDNILVSVSFNKDKPQQQQQQQQTTIVTLPPTKEQILNKRQNERDAIKRSRRTNRDSTRKHRKVDIKPVAIIDLDNSPFKEVTPSPRAVIILSDSDHENDKSNKNQSLNYSVVSNATDSIANDEIDDRGTNIHVNLSPQSPAGELAKFELPMGPKTPPEPSHLVKFSISTNTKTKVRTVVNPLHDENDDDDDEDDDNDDDDDDDDDDGHDDDDASNRSMENKESNIENAIGTGEKAQNIVQNQQKVGPNTPPGPCSPDVYDPFEPTKSPSQSPNDSINDTAKNEPQKLADDNSKSTKPVDLSMALINSKASIDAAATMLSNTLGVETNENDIPNDDANVSPFKDKPIDDNLRERDVITSKSAAGIHVFSNILFTSVKDGGSRLQTQSTAQSRSTALTIQNLSSVNVAASSSKQSPHKFGAGTIISKLPLPKITKPNRHNGNDNDNMDIESPYSPGSSDYEDLFEPPPNSPLTQSQVTGNHGKKYSARQSIKPSAAGMSSSAPKMASGDLFDDLFGNSPPTNKHKQSKKRSSKHNSSIKDWIAVTKHSTQPGTYSKLNEEQLRILSDDVPGSAVELQAQDKFLRKLNRQERVIEEVKLVLKPHYNKKHITKDEYKEIMRRAVPKICHNRTGEINPKRIKKLIEAYVAKFRQKRKMHQSTNSAIK